MHKVLREAAPREGRAVEALPEGPAPLDQPVAQPRRTAPSRLVEQQSKARPPPAPEDAQTLRGPSTRLAAQVHWKRDPTTWAQMAPELPHPQHPALSRARRPVGPRRK